MILRSRPISHALLLIQFYPGAKTVTFFLGDYLSGSLRPQLEEVQRAAWLKPEDSKKYLVFDRDREIFNDALREIGYKTDSD